MIKVKNNQTGEVKTLPDDSNLPDMVSSGEFSIPKKDYEFLSPEGDKYAVPASGFLDAVKQGWKHQNQMIKEDERLEAKYGDSPGKALALGAARGLTLGLSDVALEKSGLVSEETLRETQNRNAGASGVGEIGATIIPAFFTGGTSVAAKLAAKTGPGLIAKLAAKQGSRAAQNVTSEIGKKLIQFGVEGAIDGAGAGLTQSVSEAELGDAEFNAETILSNVGTGALAGAAFGSVIGGGSHYISKVTKSGQKKIVDKFINQVDGDEAFKESVRKRLTDQDSLEEGLLSLKDPDIQAIKSRNPEAPITSGMESGLKPIKNVENYLFDAPTSQGEAVRRKSAEIAEYTEKQVDDIWKGAKTTTPEETGDLIRQSYMGKVNEAWESGKSYYRELMNEFGGVPVNQKHRNKLLRVIEKSDAFRIAKEGPDIKRIMTILGDNEDLTLRQIKELQSDAGAAVKMTKGSERTLLREVSDNLRKMQDSIIRDSIGNSASAQKVIKGLDAANADYVRAYKVKDEIAEVLNLKGRDFDDVLEKLEKMSALDLDKRFLNVKKSDKAFEILKNNPEIGKLVLANRQSALLKKHITQNGVNYAGIKKELLKMEPQERAIYFGGNKKQEQKMMDALTLFEKRPKTLNPSGTDVRRELRDFLSPKTHVENWVLGEIYKGNGSAVGKLVNKVVPNLAGIEQSANRTKNKIASSINGFFKATSVGVAATTLEMLGNKDIEKARKNYEMAQYSPDLIIEKFTKNNKDLIESAPETANALQQRIIAGVQFLQSKTPHRDQNYIGEKLEPSRSELIKFNDYVEAVEKPQIIYEQLKQGYLNPNTLETLRTVYPKIYGSIQAEVLARLPKTLTRAQKIQLQPLLGSKVTPAMDYQNLMRLQGKTQESAQAKDQATQEVGKVSLGAAKNINASDRAKTGLDKALYRS